MAETRRWWCRFACRRRRRPPASSWWRWRSCRPLFLSLPSCSCTPVSSSGVRLPNLHAVEKFLWKFWTAVLEIENWRSYTDGVLEFPALWQIATNLPYWANPSSLRLDRWEWGWSSPAARRSKASWCDPSSWSLSCGSCAASEISAQPGRRWRAGRGRRGWAGSQKWNPSKWELAWERLASC